jgi:hypothetical protein
LIITAEVWDIGHSLVSVRIHLGLGLFPIACFILKAGWSSQLKCEILVILSKCENSFAFELYSGDCSCLRIGWSLQLKGKIWSLQHKV